MISRFLRSAFVFATSVLFVGVTLSGCGQPVEADPDREVYYYLQDRWDYYEAKDGAYIPEQHDPKVFKEAATHFDIKEAQAIKIFSKVENEELGLEPAESVVLSSRFAAVDVEVKDVELLSDNRLKVTIENRTQRPIVLPTINLTFDLFKDEQKVGFQIVWIEDLGYMETDSYHSLQISRSFDAVRATGYMNVTKLEARRLRSKIQAASSPGETVIPILETEMLKVR